MGISSGEEYESFMEGKFKSMNEAAIAWSNIYLPESVKDNKEYGGIIYEVTTKLSDGSIVTAYGYTKAVKGSVGKVNPFRAMIYKPCGAKIVALIHTHVYDAEAGYTIPEIFSAKDKKVASVLKSRFIWQLRELMRKLAF